MNQQVINAAQWNQSGGSCLEANQFAQAQRYFQLALESVALTDHDIPAEARLTLATARSQPPSALVSQESISKTNPHESGGYIYSRPFFFNPAATAIREEDMAPYGAVILFNLALTYHEQSRTLGESALFVALKLYEKSLSLLRNGTTHFDCSNVKIAALNNQARIYEELLDYGRAKRRYNLLDEILHDVKVRIDTLEEEDLQDIYLNIFFFEFPTCAAMA